MARPGGARALAGRAPSLRDEGDADQHAKAHLARTPEADTSRQIQNICMYILKSLGTMFPLRSTGSQPAMSISAGFYASGLIWRPLDTMIIASAYASRRA